MKHGDPAGIGYSYHGCRCDACTEANRARHAKWRATGPPVYQHGLSGYTNQGCRCDICTEANKAKCRAYRETA